MSEGFYRGLASNRSVDEAVTFARQLIQAENRKSNGGFPCLYMRSEDGKIFKSRDTGLRRPRDSASEPHHDLEKHQAKRRGIHACDAANAANGRRVDAATHHGKELLERLSEDRPLAGAGREDLSQAWGWRSNRSNEISKAAASFAYAVKLGPQQSRVPRATRELHCDGRIPRECAGRHRGGDQDAAGQCRIVLEQRHRVRLAGEIRTTTRLHRRGRQGVRRRHRQGSSRNQNTWSRERTRWRNSGGSVRRSPTWIRRLRSPRTTQSSRPSEPGSQHRSAAL